MTGLGVNYFITWGIWLRHCLNGLKDQYTMQWPHKLLSLPNVVPSVKDSKPQRLQYAKDDTFLSTSLGKKEM
jgi:dihydroceramidase